MPIQSRPGFLVALGAIFLVSVNFFIYEPAFNRVFVDDHVLYMAQLNGSTRLSDGLALCDYNIVRKYMKGDELLYRPLLFAGMAVENSLFSVDHVAWNIANFAIHLAIVFMLWALLHRINPSPTSFVFTLLFSVMAAQVELVTWCHLGGYLWACFFLLGGLYCFREAGELDAPRRAAWMAGCAISFTLAAFFHEFCLLVAFFIAVIAALSPRQRRLAPMMLVPLVLYTAFYIPHILHAERFWFRAGVSEQQSFIARAASLTWAALEVIGKLIQRACMPGSLVLQIIAYNRFLFRFDTWQPANLVAIPALLCVFAFSKAQLSRNKPLVAILLLGIFVFTAMIAFGRTYTPLYYSYIFHLLAIVLLYCVLDFSKLSRALHHAAVAGLFLFTALNGYYASKACRQCYNANFIQHQFLADVASFVEQHKTEPAFSFASANVPELINPQLKLSIGFPDTPSGIDDRPMDAVLFPAWYKSQNPLYRLEWNPKEFRVVARKTTP